MLSTFVINLNLGVLSAHAKAECPTSLKLMWPLAISLWSKYVPVSDGSFNCMWVGFHQIHKLGEKSKEKMERIEGKDFVILHSCDRKI